LGMVEYGGFRQDNRLMFGRFFIRPFVYRDWNIFKISVSFVLALPYFPRQAAVPITLYILFQQPVAAVIPLLFKRNLCRLTYNHAQSVRD
jgi:hypothetical protein